MEISNASTELAVLEKVRAARRQLVENGPAAVRTTGDFERVALPHADADVLRDLVAAECSTTVIEVGLAYGASALAIAEALVSLRSSCVRHVIIDAYRIISTAPVGTRSLRQGSKGCARSSARDHSLRYPVLLATGFALTRRSSTAVTSSTTCSSTSIS